MSCLLRLISLVKVNDIIGFSAIVNNDFDLNSTDNDGNNILMNACMMGRVEIAKIILSKNINVNAQNDEGLTALMLAFLSHSHTFELVSVLIQYNADPNITNENGWSPLVYAFLFPNEHTSSIIKLLIAHKANVNLVDQYGFPLFVRILSTYSRDDTRLIQILIDHGIDVDLTDGDGKSSIDYAQLRGFHNILNLLKTNSTHSISDIPYNIDTLNTTSESISKDVVLCHNDNSDDEYPEVVIGFGEVVQFGIGNGFNNNLGDYNSDTSSSCLESLSDEDY